jgi:putative ABC transport system permease protein
VNLTRLVRKSLRQHALSTGVTALGVALAGGLVMSVWVLRDQAERAFAGMTGGADAVLGARGSKLQLVLNAVFHLDESPGNLAWSEVEEIRRHPSVEVAVPMAGGDNYRGYRVVGTTLELFERLEYAPGRRLTVRPPGRRFDPTAREAVVGSFVARRLGLKRGDEIHPYHGLVFDAEHRHEEDYVVVGVLEPSNTPADRVIWIPLEGIQKMSRHDPRAAAEVSAVLVRFKAGSPLIGKQLETQYNREGTRLTFAWPIARIVAQLSRN